MIDYVRVIWLAGSDQVQSEDLPLMYGNTTHIRFDK